MVKNMRLAGLYPWMLTGDSGINALTCAYSTNIIDIDTPLLHLEGKNYEALKLLVRDHLNIIQVESKLNKLIPQNLPAYKKYLRRLLVRIFTNSSSSSSSSLPSQIPSSIH